MPRRLQYKEEFYEAYKLHVRGLATGLIRDSFENPDMTTSEKIDVKTINNWKRKWKEHEDLDIDESWDWSKADEYETAGLPSLSGADIERNVAYYWEYLRTYLPSYDKFSNIYPTRASVREMKYINLFTVLGKGVWDLKEVMERAREYARTEFLMEFGEYDQKEWQKYRWKLDEDLWRAKYRAMNQEKEDINES